MTQREDVLKFEQGRIKALQEERLHIQKKTFTKWMNSFLQKVGVTQVYQPKLDVIYNVHTLFIGENGGGRFVPGLGGWQETSQIVGDHFRGKARQTKQRTYEGTQSGKRQQKLGVSTHEGPLERIKKKNRLFFDTSIIIILYACKRFFQ